MTEKLAASSESKDEVKRIMKKKKYKLMHDEERSRNLEYEAR